MTDLLFDQPLNTLLRVVAVLVVAAAVVSAMRRSSASLRALALTATLTGTLVLPLISLAAPPLEIAVLPAERALEMPVFIETSTATAPVVHTTGERTIAEPTTPISDAPLTTFAAAAEPIPQVAQARTARDVANEMLAWFTERMSINALLLGTWMIGALLFLTRLALGHRRLGALVSVASNAGDDWHTMVDDVRRELGIRRRVDVRTSHDIDIPAVAGVFKPVLLIPASVDWSASAKRDVVLHELAHVARWDALAQLLSNVSCAIYWFIPLTWYAARHAAALREQACDNVVLRAGTRPSLYAQRLLTFSHASMSTALEPAALAMARPANIQRRVLGILDTNTRRTRLSASFTTAFIAASLAMVAFVAIVEPVAASEPLQVRVTPVAQTPSRPPVPVAASVPLVKSAVALPAPSAALPGVPAAAGVPSAPASVSLVVPVPKSEPISSSFAASPATSSSTEIPSSSSIAAPSDFTVPIIVPTVAASAAANPPASFPVQQQTLVICKDGTKSNSIHSNSSGSSRTWRLTASGPGCDISVRIEGKPTFNQAFTDIERISGRGTFEIDIRQDGVRRELRIRDDNGRLTRTYRVDGRERPYDADAAAWFGQVLIALDRQTAFAVDIRLPLLLERGGVNAVLAETGQMPSDYARSSYYTALSKSRRLTSQELTSVINQGAELTKSDYYSAELLKGVAAQGLGNPAVRDGVMRLISRMKSDYYKLESIKATVNAGQPTSNELGLLLQVVGTMESDYYRSETVKLLTSKADLSSSQLTDVLSIASKMKSDYHINEMLGSLIARGTLDADKRLAYLTAVRAIDSDYHRAETLGKLLKNGPPTSGEMDLLFTAISEIDSDHHMGEVLDRLLASRSLREADLLRAEEVARSIGSDHTHSEVLRRIGSHAAATDAVRSAVHSAAASLSRHYRELVQRGVER